MATKIISFLKVSIGILISVAMTSAYAEYYYVTTDAPGVPNGCGCKVVHHKVRPCYKKKRYHKPRRKRHRRCWRECTVTMPQPRPYYVYQDSPCGCGDACGGYWRQGGCDTWVPNGWQENGYYYYFNDIGYNPDLATGDDDTWVNPNLQINY